MHTQMTTFRGYVLNVWKLLSWVGDKGYNEFIFSSEYALCTLNQQYLGKINIVRFM